jgi:hypothetical protein
MTFFGSRFSYPRQVLVVLFSFLCISPLFAQVIGPAVPNVIEAYQQAVENKDPVAAYALLGPALRGEETLERFLVRFKRDYPLILEESRRLNSFEKSSLRAEVPLGTTTADLIWTDEGWRIKNPNAILLAGQREGVYQALLDFVLDKDLEQASQAFLKREEQTRLPGRFWTLKTLIVSMEREDDDVGSLRRIPLKNERDLVLVRVKKGWRLHDIQWLIDP